MSAKQEFPEILRDLRNERSLGVREVAKAIGVTIGSISSWERGIMKPTYDKVIALADYFGVSLNYLVGRED